MSIGRFILLLTLALVAVGISGGCDQKAMIHSHPSGALVRVDGEEVGKTPVAFNASGGKSFWGSSYVVEASKEGYVTQSQVWRPAYNAWGETHWPDVTFYLQKPSENAEASEPKAGRNDTVKAVD